MVHQGFAWRALVQGLFERIERQVASKRARHAPADDGTREYIDDEGDVGKADPRRHVRDVRHPQLVRSTRHERTLHEVGWTD